MKQLTRILFTITFSILAFAMVAMADHSLSSTKQAEFDEIVLLYFKSGDLNKLQNFINGIPPCVRTNDMVPPICNIDLNDNRNFVRRARQNIIFYKEDLEKYLGEDYQEFTMISVDSAIHNALNSFFIHKTSKSPMASDAVKYMKSFYDENFKGSWLADKVQQSLILRQEGDFFSKYDPYYSVIDGRKIYPSYYIPYLLGEDIFQFSTAEIIYNPNEFNEGRGSVHRILNWMRLEAKMSESKDLLTQIAHSWFHSLISPVQWDKKEMAFYEKDYVGSYDESKPKGYEYDALKYQAAKQRSMYKFFNDEGWQMFAEAGVVPTDWEKHTIDLNIKACRRVLNNHHESNYEEICSAFEQGAAKYGFYYLPHVEPSIEDQIAEIQTQFQEKYALPI